LRLPSIRAAVTGLVAAVALGGSALMAASPAGATAARTAAPSIIVTAAHTITSNGEGGYAVTMNEPGHFTQVKFQFYVRKAAQTIGSSPTAGGMGVQLANDSSDSAVQLGFEWNGPGCSGQGIVGYGNGTLPGTNPGVTPGTDTTVVNAGGLLSPLELAPNLCASVGDTIKGDVTEVFPGEYEVFAKDMTTDVSVSKEITSLAFPDELNIGTVADLTSRSAPANIKLVHFAYLSITDSNGVTAGLVSPEWSAQPVGSNPSGNDANPLLVAPSALTGGGHHFDVYVGAQTGA
jgi:hypothetical protein